MIRAFLVSLLVVVASASDAGAWGDLGHQAIAYAAYQLLDEPTRAAVARAAGIPRLRAEDLARMATWADDIRRLERTGTHALDPQEIREAETFARRFPDHPTWHYVNLPLGEPYPAHATAYTRPDDVVGSLLHCVAVLEGRDTTAGLSQRIALRFLVHLAGDIHQPLHVGAGYFDIHEPAMPRLVRDRAGARRTVVSDLGGNRLTFATTNLHATWDHGLVVALGVPDARRLAAELLASMGTNPPPARSGSDYLGWPRDWATEASRVAANIAYPPLRFGPARGKTGEPARPNDVDHIDIVAPSYDEYVGDLGVRAAVRAQLARAAARLAALLSRIHWR